MAGICKAFAKRTPLHREIAVIVERCDFIDAPGKRAVVEEQIFPMALPYGIGTVVDILDLRAARTNEAHNYIVATEVQRVISQRDSTLRRRLSGNSGIFGYTQIGLEVDITTHIKYNGFRAALLQSPAQRAFGGVAGVICQIGHMDYFSSTATGCETSVSLGTRKSRRLCYRSSESGCDKPHRK